MDTASRRQRDAIERARYKLSQADLALRYLRQTSTEIASDLRRGRSEPDLRLDTFFFSCLGLAKSACYILEGEQGGRYRDAIHSWRMNVLDLKGRTQFNKMMKLRDIDVHQGRSDARMLGAMMPIERSSDGWMQQQQPNYAVHGIPRPATERTNPDGETVSSYEGLQSTICLYVEIAGETCEASRACERFIAQLTSLLDRVQAANVPPLNLLQRLWLWCRAKLRLRD